MARLRGSYTVMVTPFSADGSRIDEPALRRFVDWQIAEGTQGLIPLGSTGEFLSLTDEERHEVGRIVVEQARGRVPVLVGTAAEWTDSVVRYSREAEALGADGVMIVPPFYSSPSEDELFAHYRRVAEAIGIPIMVYNNPHTANVDLTPRLVARLSRIDNVRYLKESSGDVTRVGEILRLCGERMTVFAGYHPYEAYVLGAEGYVSVCANIVPRLSAELFTRTVDEDDRAGGRDLYHRLLPLLDAIGGDLYVAATKEALDLIGMPVGVPRPPRLPLPEARVEALRGVLKELGVRPADAA